MAEVRVSRVAWFFGLAFLSGLGILRYLFGILPTETWRWGIDVYSNWLGSRLMWQGQNPYSERATDLIHQLIFGRSFIQGDPIFRFFYPAWIGIILLPLLFLPLDWAVLIWCASGFAILATLVAIWAWNLNPQPSLWLWGIFLLTGIFFRPAVNTILFGQYPLFVLAMGALSLGLISRGYDGFGGIFLVLATIKPSVALLGALALLIWATRWKRWRVLIGFATAIVLMLGVTTVPIGWWVPDFVHQVLGYSADNEGLNLGWAPGQITTAPGVVWLAGTMVLLWLGFARLWRSPTTPWLALIAATSLNLIASPHSLEYDLTMLLLPLLWLGSEWYAKRWGMAVWVALVWLPWLVWLGVIASNGLLEDFRKGVWQFYPSLLIGLTLIWVGHAKVQSVVARAAQLLVPYRNAT